MSATGEQIDSDETQDRDYEAEARQLGWHPQDEFRGNAADWVDARTFVSRGENQLPILRENNRKLSQRVRRADDEIAGLRATVDEVNTSLKTLRTMAEKSNEAGYQRAKAELEAQQRQAVTDGDLPRFEHIAGEIARVEAAREEIAPKPESTPTPENKGPKATPEFQAWLTENNDWVRADPILARAAVQAELDLRQGDDPLTEAQIWDGVTEAVQSKYPRRFAAATGTVLQAREPVETHMRRAAPVLSPRSGAPANQVRKGGLASILDADERKVAQAAFNSIRRSIPDYTEAEYMKVYINPNADVIPDAISRKVKANGATH